LEIGWYLAAHSADGLRVGYNSLGGKEGLLCVCLFRLTFIQQNII